MVTTTDTVPQQLLLLHYSLEIITTQLLLLLLYPFANNCVFKVGGMRYLSCAQVYPILIFLLSQSVFERRVAHFNLMLHCETGMQIVYNYCYPHYQSVPPPGGDDNE